MWTEFPHVIQRDTLAWKTFEEVWIHISIPFHKFDFCYAVYAVCSHAMPPSFIYPTISYFVQKNKHPLQVNLRVKNKKPSNEAWYWYKKGKEQEHVQSASWGITVSIRSVPLNKRSVHSVADAP
jgi:hypothetical protein